MPVQKKWNLVEPAADKVHALQSALRINPVICRTLVGRHIETFEQAREYFRPSLSALHDPWLMKDMKQAVERILLAFDNLEKIMVFGDYDVDGTTAVACMYTFLQNVYRPELLDFYIPHRYREGYGVSRAGIDFASQQQCSLIICLDCGIKSTDLIAYARENGVDFIICDHHLPDAVLPSAVAILNPKQKDCDYPYKELCGSGVGFKLITALAARLGKNSDWVFGYLDLVAIAIAADVVPMTGENRVLAYHGLRKVNENPNYGIRALIQLSGLSKKLNINDLLFMIAPRVNAAGRMDDAKKAVNMFIAPDFEHALYYANMLHIDNSDRKQMDLLITEEALAIIEGDKELAMGKTTVVFQPHWHKGVVGIVASRLIEKYYRPTVVLTQSGEVLTGSARSVNGFNLYEAIDACREHLLGYGGHFAAAGMTLLPEQLSAFSRKFEEVVAATILSSSLVPEIVVDAEIRFTEITVPFYNILCQMEPFGPENTRPVFVAREVSDTGYSRIAKEAHIRFSLRQQKVAISGVGFNLAGKFPLLQSGKPIDIVFTIDQNDWKDQKTLQLKVIDMLPSLL